MKIGEIFKTDIGRDINPVIKVADLSEDQLREELDSYVVTGVIERYLEDFLNHYVETRLKDTDHIGVWLYGFVGAGKSHFAKIIGLLLANPTVVGQRAIDRFIPRVQICKRPKEIERLLFEIRNNIATEVIPFHINSEAQQAGEDKDNIAKIFYRMFLRYLGFSEDIRIAYIEQTLVRSEKYGAFKVAVKTKTGAEWETVRKPDYWDLYRQEIFSTLAEILPTSYSSPEDAQRAFEGKQPLVTFHDLAERVAGHVSELDEKDPGRTHRVLFIVDELGAFIADSGKKLHDVGSLAEEFAKVGKGKIWIFATGHDSLKDLVDNAREYLGDFRWLEGRFKKQYTLTAENIEVVLEERLFKKSTRGEDALKDLFEQKQGAISELGKLLKASRSFPDLDSQDRFISCYPFRPYQLILTLEILHSIRTVGGRSDVLSGSTRSLLGITQGILARTEYGYKEAEIGKIVPFDHIYGQIQDMEVPSQIRTEINKIRIPDDQPFPLKRILQTLYLAQQLDYIPTSPRNLALLIADHIDTDISALEAEIVKGLEQLQRAAYVIETGGLYKYISGEERDDAELVAQKKAEVKTVHRREKIKDEFFSEHVLPIGRVNYQGTYPFEIRVVVDGRFNEEYTGGQVIHSKGDLELRVVSCLSATLNDANVDALEERSLSEPTVVYWLSNKSSKIEELLTTLIGTQNAMQPIDTDASQSTERRKRARRYLDELETHTRPQIVEGIRRCLREGHIVFQGNAHSIASGGDNLNVILNREMSAIIPRVYTQFNRARYKILNERKTIEGILTEGTNKLKTIGESASQPSGLSLFDDQGNLKTTTPSVADIYDFLETATQRGERINGNGLLSKFTSIPYGWDQNLIRVIAAALFRSNRLVVRYENTSYRDFKVEEARKIFLDSRRFNRAELTLDVETPPSMAELQKARQELEIICGIRAQETPSAIADSLKQKISELLNEHQQLQAWVEGAQFPADDSFTKAPDTLNEVIDVDRPNTIVKKFLEVLGGFRGAVSSINSLATFYDSSDKKKFSDMVPLLQVGRFLRDRVDRNEVPNTVEATDFLEQAWREKTLLKRFPEASTLLLQAEPELREKFDKLKSGCIDAIIRGIEQLSSFAKHEGLSEEEFTEHLKPLQNKKESRETAHFDLQGEELTIQSLWGDVPEIEALEDQTHRTIEHILIEKKGVKQRKRKRLRVRELREVPRVIRNEEDLDKTLSSIEKAVKDVLKQDTEVELN